MIGIFIHFFAIETHPYKIIRHARCVVLLVWSDAKNCSTRKYFGACTKCHVARKRHSKAPCCCLKVEASPFNNWPIPCSFPFQTPADSGVFFRSKHLIVKVRNGEKFWSCRSGAFAFVLGFQPQQAVLIRESEDNSDRKPKHFSQFPYSLSHSSDHKCPQQKRPFEISHFWIC